MTEKCGNCGHEEVNHLPKNSMNNSECMKINHCKCKEFKYPKEGHKPNHSPQGCGKYLPPIGSYNSCGKRTPLSVGDKTIKYCKACKPNHSPQDIPVSNERNVTTITAPEGTSTLSDKIDECEDGFFIEVKDVKESVQRLMKKKCDCSEEEGICESCYDFKKEFGKDLI